MTQKVALVTNVLDYVGPPAVEALLEENYTVIAHAAAFQDTALKAEYESKHPQTVAVYFQEPSELIAYAWREYPQVDVIISNDAYPAIHGSIENAQLADLMATIESLMVFPFKLMQAAIPHLKRQSKANVILITSSRTELPLVGGAIPDMARAGANALVKSLSLELAPYGIPVNAIAPNYLYSEAYFPKAQFIDNPVGSDFIKRVVPAGRLGEPKEMGELVKYLANMQGAFHTGTIIKFAGGWPAAPKRPL